MIRISGLRVPLSFDFSGLTEFCADRFRIDRSKIKSVQLSKKSVDARKKNDVHFSISVDIEAVGEDRLLHSVKNAVKVEKYEYKIPVLKASDARPVIVGFGPGGMFAALVLAIAGARPIVLERGGDVDSRCAAVETFRNGGKLDTECNVQFGEGGAGTFSDGKLTTGIKDRRIGWIFRRLVEFGAPDEIIYSAKPHIGTDKLRHVVKALRERVISLGGEVCFNAKFCGFERTDGEVSAAIYSDRDGVHKISTNSVILATGHSARDVFELLKKKKNRPFPEEFCCRCPYRA